MPRSKQGFTLVELLVVLAVIGILVALLLPAVLAAREASRQTICKNNLRQIGAAALIHHETHQHLPAGGWGSEWVGDPTLGFGAAQPGGWIYNSLPFLDQEQLYVRENAEFVGFSVPTFYCPSRRPAKNFAYTDPAPMKNLSVLPTRAGKTDYAANSGDRFVHSCVSNFLNNSDPKLSGVVFSRSVTRLGEIVDGLSVTYYAGEKYMNSEGTQDGRAMGDEQTMYVGDDEEIRRFTEMTPMQDKQTVECDEIFGSAHVAGCHFVFCDGSVRLIEYSIDETVHRQLGNRKDRTPFDDLPF